MTMSVLPTINKMAMGVLPPLKIFVKVLKPLLNTYRLGILVLLMTNKNNSMRAQRSIYESTVTQNNFLHCRPEADYW